MDIKWIGAFLIVAGCGGFGFSLAAAHRREAALLRGLQRALQYMQNELKYRLTPLPELCAQAGAEAGGQLKLVFTDLSRAMERQLSPDAASCMMEAIRKSKESLPPSMRRLLGQLGRSLGRFDLEGQLRGLAALEKACGEVLDRLEENKDLRLRNYQTLGLCAGAALAILFA